MKKALILFALCAPVVSSLNATSLEAEFQARLEAIKNEVNAGTYGTQGVLRRSITKAVTETSRTGFGVDRIARWKTAIAFVNAGLGQEIVNAINALLANHNRNETQAHQLASLRDLLGEILDESREVGIGLNNLQALRAARNAAQIVE